MLPLRAVYTLGCTAKLRERLGTPPAEARPQPTTRLGDWYAHPLKHGELVLCVSLETLLPVLVPLAPEATLALRVAKAVGEVLRALGVPPADADAEVAAMRDWACGRSTRRWINDAMVDLEWQLESRTGDGPGPSHLELSLFLAETPSSVIGWRSPDEATRERFGLSPLRHRLESASPPVRPAGGAAPPKKAPGASGIAWTPLLAVGVPEIDRQHQALFAAFAELVDAVLAGQAAGQVSRLLDFLARYVVEHFSAEERAMQASAYPGSAAHKAEHDAFVAELQALRDQLRRDGPNDALAAALGGRVRSWLSFHIGGSDRAMGRHLQGA